MRSSLFFWLLPLLAAPLAGQADALVREARSKDPSRRSAALEALVALGEEGRPHLVRALQEIEKELLAARGQLFASPAFAAARGVLEAELVGARQEALAYIRDETRFGKHLGIEGMQALVSRVRGLWERPEEFLSERINALGTIMDQARQVSLYAGPAALPALAETAQKCLAAIRAAVAVELMGFSPAQVRWNSEVMGWNEQEAPTSAGPDEIEVVQLTNGYRLMMGLRALELDERILRAARAHSQEMEDLGYFSHTSPVAAHASPGARMRIHGYSGPLGENIAVALSAPQAFQGWFLSAGHHRNMLSNQATAIAVGRSRGREGSYLWTMNLGGGDSLRGKTLTDLSLLYLQRKRQLSMEDPASVLELARWCASRGLIKEMSEACRIALRLDPGLREARELLARRFEMAEKARK